MIANLKSLNRHTQFAGQSNLPVRKSVFELTESDREEALALLCDDPISAVHLIGMLEDYGVVHEAHRGQFFGYYENDKLAGVALLGHSILIYGKEASLPYFAEATIKSKAKGHVIFGPRKQVESFWSSLEKLGWHTRLVREYHWFVSHRSAKLPKSLQLRKASLDDIQVVANAQAQMVFEASGIDPRETDFEGYYYRVAERIKRGRVWIKIEDGKLVFKADLVNQTSDTSYLEGIWTDPEYRDKGIATECLSELVHRLLYSGSIPCLVVEPHDEIAKRVYRKVGFMRSEEYQARYLNPLEA